MVTHKDTHIPPGYKKTEVGVIPEEWEVIKIGEKAIFLKTASLPRKQLLPEGTIWYVHYGDIHASDNVFLDLHKTALPFAPSNYVGTIDRLKEGDLVFVDASEDLEGVGKSVEIKNANKKEAIAGLHTIAVRLSRDVFTHGFKAYLQFIPQFKSHLRKLAAGTKVYATQKHHIGSALIPLPPLPEQRAIARVLSDVDALLEALDALIAKKRALKTAAMQQLLTGKRRLPGFEGEWVIKRLGDISTMSSGGTPTTSNPGYYGGDIRWVSISDMTNAGKYIDNTERCLSIDGLKNSAAKIFPSGTVLYAMYASLGECSIAKKEMATSQAILGIQPHADYLDNEYLYYYLVSIKEKVKSFGQHGTQANLNKNIVENFQIPTPPLAEQRAIAAVLSDMDAEIAALEARREKVRQLKQGMMQVLLTGKVRLVGAKTDGRPLQKK